jgi:hypothetical protein
LSSGPALSSDNECHPLLTNDEIILTPMRSNPPTDSFGNDANRETILDIPLLIAIADGNGNGINLNRNERNENSGFMHTSEPNGNGSASSLTIPIFTVTINPLEADEVTYVPDSPTDFPAQKKIGLTTNGRKVIKFEIPLDDKYNPEAIFRPKCQTQGLRQMTMKETRC